MKIEKCLLTNNFLFHLVGGELHRDNRCLTLYNNAFYSLYKSNTDIKSMTIEKIDAPEAILIRAALIHKYSHAGVLLTLMSSSVNVNYHKQKM